MGNTATSDLGDLATSGMATRTLVVIPTAEWTITNTAGVSSDKPLRGTVHDTSTNGRPQPNHDEAKKHQK